MTEQVGIVIGVDARQTAKLTSAAAAVDEANKQQLKSAQARLKTNDRLVDSLLKEASATGVATKAQIEQIAATRAASAAIETEVLAIRSLRAEAAAADAARMRQLAARAAAEKEFDIVYAKLAADKVERDKQEKASAAALFAQKLEYLGKNEAAEIASRRRSLLEQSAYESQMRKERLKTFEANAALNVRERASRSGVAGQIGTGALSAAGVGFGANALGAGLGAGLALGYSSNMAIQLERTNQALIAVTGSSAAAAREFKFVDAQAYRLGININKLGFQYAQFTAASKGTALEGEQARDIFLSVAEASQKLGLRTEETEGALRALGQMMSKGRVQAEELRGQLGDRLSGAFQIFARGAGLSTAELDKMLQAGGVIATEMLPGFGRELRKTFGTDANTQINTTISNFTRLTNEIKLAAAAFGGLVNKAAGPAAGYIADQLRDLRVNSPRFQREARLGETFSQFKARVASEQSFAQMTTVSAPTGSFGLDFNSMLGVPEKAPSPWLSGSSLLKSGVDPKENLRLDRERKKEQQEQLQLAKKASAEAARAASEEIQRQREYVAERIRLVAIEEDIAEAMTKAAAADLKSAMSDEEDARTLSARNAAANSKFLGRLGKTSPGRRFDGYARAASDMTDSLIEEGNRYSGVQIRADATKESQDQIEKYAREHEERLAAIKEEGEKRRGEITRGYLDAGKAALGDAAEFAQAMGKKGFEAYKALSIAQTIISTIQSAQEAYKSLVGSFPGIPGLGQGLAVAAAIAATAAGIARVNTIKNQSYGGGREFGGPVSHDQFYEIGEKRKPEVVETAGKFYMFNANGRVQPGQNFSASQSQAPVVRLVNPPGVPLVAEKAYIERGEMVVLLKQAASSGAAMAEARVMQQAGNPSSQFNARLRSANKGVTARGNA